MEHVLAEDLSQFHCHGPAPLWNMEHVLAEDLSQFYCHGPAPLWNMEHVLAEDLSQFHCHGPAPLWLCTTTSYCKVTCPLSCVKMNIPNLY